MNAALYSLPYDLLGSFEPVAPLVTTPVTLFARETMPGKDLSELIAWLKANPDKANHAATTAGIQVRVFKPSRTEVKPRPHKTWSVVKWTFFSAAQTSSHS
jgi:Tripartite tricarboxylate transporter family receptor